MRVGRRPLFFAALAAICLGLVPATPAEFRWVNFTMAGLALLWAVAIGIEEIAAGRGPGRRRQS